MPSPEADAARGYVSEHGLLSFVDDVFSEILSLKPDSPFDVMLRHVMRYRASFSRHVTVGAISLLQAHIRQLDDDEAAIREAAVARVSAEEEKNNPEPEEQNEALRAFQEFLRELEEKERVYVHLEEEICRRSLFHNKEREGRLMQQLMHMQTNYGRDTYEIIKESRGPANTWGGSTAGMWSATAGSGRNAANVLPSSPTSTKGAPIAPRPPANTNNTPNRTSSLRGSKMNTANNFGTPDWRPVLQQQYDELWTLDNTTDAYFHRSGVSPTNGPRLTDLNGHVENDTHVAGYNLRQMYTNGKTKPSEISTNTQFEAPIQSIISRDSM